jgi:hypothetical protein
MIPPTGLLDEMLDRADRSLRSQDPTTRQLAQDVDTLVVAMLTTRNQSSSDQPLQHVIGELMSQHGIGALISALGRQHLMRLAESKSRQSVGWAAVHEKSSETADLVEALKNAPAPTRPMDPRNASFTTAIVRIHDSPIASAPIRRNAQSAIPGKGRMD